MENKMFGRWIFILAGLIINLCLGTIYAWSVFRFPLHQNPYNLTPAESVIPFSIFLLAFGISFAFSGRMIGKLGPKRPAVIGAILLGLGYILSYTITILPDSSLWIISISFGLISGTGCGYAYNPPIAVISRWFPDRRGLALGLTVMGFGLSALITAPIVNNMISGIGLANTFLVLGVIFFVILSILGSFLRFPTKEWKAPLSHNKNKAIVGSTTSNDFTVSQMTKTSTFYISWIIYFIGAGAGLMIIGYAKLIATDVTGLKGGLEWLATLSVSILAVSNAVGRPVFGFLCDKLGPRKTLFIIQGIQLFCLLVLFPYSKHIEFLYLAIILFAASFGAYMAVMPTLASYFFGSKNLGPNYGLYFSAYGVGGVVFPMLMSTLLGLEPTYETYVQGFYLTAGIILISFFLTIIMKVPRIKK